jgi:hypothetical protein
MCDSNEGAESNCVTVIKGAEKTELPSVLFGAMLQFEQQQQRTAEELQELRKGKERKKGSIE